MCGICGVFSLDGPLPPEFGLAVPAMTDALEHRGPDAHGVVSLDRAAFGHRRLSIIDLAQGAQPMTNEDGSCWITFNGEIYNHRAAGRDLAAKGHRFRTASDTEVILHAYEEYGPGCVDRLEGMFAFAVYDGRTGELFAARDRLGKKPFYYAVFGNVLHFASEIKALACSPAWNPEPDLAGLEGYLSLGYSLAPATVYRHVRSLEPGHLLRARNGRLEVRRYWDVERFDDDPRGEEALLDELDGLLGELVAERLESEVPLGAFLSGGIDSGLVVSYMAEAPGGPVTTTTVGFGESGHNEIDAATWTATRYGTRHHPHVIAPRLEEVLEPIARAFDEPFADASAIPTYYVSQIARGHVTVALSGDGGDEVFGGYALRYVPHAVEGCLRRAVPGLSGSRAAGWLGRRWPRSRRLPRALRAGAILENLSHDPAAAYFLDLCFMKPWDARRLLGRPASRDPQESPVFDAVAGAYRRCPSSSPLQRAQYADLKVYLPGDMLVKVDRMSMQHALEVRCPLLDRRLVEFGFRIPAEVKSPRFRSKHLLRRLGARRLPPALLRLPKHGFTAPVAEWIRGPYADRFRADVLGPASPVRDLLDQQRLATLFEEHRRGTADHWYPLWAAWMLERWATVQREARNPKGVRQDSREEHAALVPVGC